MRESAVLTDWNSLLSSQSKSAIRAAECLRSGQPSQYCTCLHRRLPPSARIRIARTEHSHQTTMSGYTGKCWLGRFNRISAMWLYMSPPPTSQAAVSRPCLSRQRRCIQYNKHRSTVKVSVTNSVSDQMWNMVGLHLCRSWVTALCFYCMKLWCHSEADLWRFGHKCYYFIICPIRHFCLKCVIMSIWFLSDGPEQFEFVMTCDHRLFFNFIYQTKWKFLLNSKRLWRCLWPARRHNNKICWYENPQF